LKPDGLFFLSTIAKTYEGYLSNILVGEYLLGLLPKGTHEYDLFISHDTVMSHVSDKLALIEAKGVSLKNPFTFEM
jgi:2-polyprenyl-6-hydroxyphenyl methylase/3-demethylubiquinone-9 3-methyltransferase